MVHYTAFQGGIELAANPKARPRMRWLAVLAAFILGVCVGRAMIPAASALEDSVDLLNLEVGDYQDTIHDLEDRLRRCHESANLI